MCLTVHVLTQLRITQKKWKMDKNKKAIRPLFIQNLYVCMY